MKTFLINCLVILVCGVASAKRNVPGMVFTMKGDTLKGTIAIHGKPCKLSNRTLYELGLELEFTNSEGKKTTYKPFDIKGFAIVCKDGSLRRFTAVALTREVTSSNPGYAGLFGGKDVVDAVFARVINDDGFLKYYDFTGYSSGFTATGGPSGAIYRIQLLQKAPEKQAIILETRYAKKNEQLIEYLGDCPKVKRVLESTNFSLRTGLPLLVDEYNRCIKEKDKN